MKQIAFVLAVLAASCGQSTDAALAEKQRALEAALRTADDASKAARDVQDKLEVLERDLKELTAKTNAAIDTIQAAQSDADRATATATLERLRREQAEAQARMNDVKAKADQAKRRRGDPQISKECQENPLAKGCM